MNIDHERCSELLGPYAAGELPEEETAAVAAHLEACDDCRAELQAVVALLEPVGGLGPGERDSLRRRVAAELGIGTPGGEVVALPGNRRGWGPRLAGGLAAAASVVAIVGGIILVGGNGTDDEAGSDGAAIEAPFGATTGPRPLFDSGTADAVTAEAAEAADAGAGGGDSEAEGAEAETASSAGVARTSAPARVRRAELQRLGATSEPFVSFARAYRAPLDPGLQHAFLEELIAAAPEELWDQIEECGQEVVEANDRVLPAYGAHRRFGAKNVLVLGFATASERNAPIDGFLFYLWPEGSCELPSTSIGGQIQP
ncbi:MAG TPA: zf-HC2 domain-containing protein [Actinomycetota bacterium]|nr:zf-HC2 domain-containing protein [Actinomycetota bacterium]